MSTRVELLQKAWDELKVKAHEVVCPHCDLQGAPKLEAVQPRCMHCGEVLPVIVVKTWQKRSLKEVAITGHKVGGVTSLAEGVKYDQGKPRYELYAPEALEGTVKVLTFGAAKYADRNWEKGMAWSRPFGAAMRHLWAWWRGEKVDPESGLSHLHHAACCIMFLQAYEARSVGTDDRAVAPAPKVSEFD